MNELKPCPFCGGKAKLTHEADISSFVICTICRTSGNHFIKKFDRSSDDEAVAWWNMRANDE